MNHLRVVKDLTGCASWVVAGLDDPDRHTTVFSFPNVGNVSPNVELEISFKINKG
jgi:hypothetical protein